MLLHVFCVALLLSLLQHVDAHVPMGQCIAPSLHQILANALARSLEWELVLLLQCVLRIALQPCLICLYVLILSVRCNR